MSTQTDPLEAASITLDQCAARLEIMARAWREEADYMRNGDRSLLGTLEGCEERYARAATASLVRGLSAGVSGIRHAVQREILRDES